MNIKLGIRLGAGAAVSLAAKLTSAFKSRVETDGGILESAACLKNDLNYLTKNPAAPTGYTVEWSGATVGSSAEFRINLVGGAGYTYTYAVTDTQANEVTGTGVMGGNIQAVTADLSTLVDGAVTVAVYLTGAGGDGPVVTDTATLVGVDADYQAILDRGTALGYTLPSPSQQVLQEALIAGGIEVQSAESTMVSSTTIEVTSADDAKQILRIMDMLEDNDDVQDVYSNFDIDESLMQELG